MICLIVLSCSELHYMYYVCRNTSSPQELCDSEGVGRRDWRSGERVAEVCKVMREEPPVSSEEIVVDGPLRLCQRIQQMALTLSRRCQTDYWKQSEILLSFITPHGQPTHTQQHTTTYINIHKTTYYDLHCVPKKWAPLTFCNSHRKPAPIKNEILHTQDDIYFCHWRQIS